MFHIIDTFAFNYHQQAFYLYDKDDGSMYKVVHVREYGSDSTCYFNNIADAYKYILDNAKESD